MYKYYFYKTLRFFHLISKKKFKKKIPSGYKIIAKSKYFDAKWYLKQNPDVKAAKIDPVIHYLQYGWKEGRNPGASFDGNDYLNSNADVRQANLNPLLHYETNGKKEGRYKEILVHLHLFYLDQLDYFLKKLKNIITDYDLYITIVKDDTDVINKIRQFKSDAHIIRVKNCGYDVYPFWQILQLVNLKRYRYVLKIHTKNYYKKFWKFADISYTRYQWRDDLVNCLIGNKFIISRNLKKLNTTNVGMVGCKNLIRKIEFFPQVANTKRLCSKMNIQYSQEPFIAGTCFFCKSSILEKFKNTRFEIEEFISKNKTGDGCSLAHSCETMFGVLTKHCGYKIKGSHTINTFIKSFIREIKKICSCKIIKHNQSVKFINNSLYFDAKWYLEENSDVKKAGMDPAKHYIKYGWKEGRNPSLKFDNEAYFNANPDVKKAGVCPLLHWEQYGRIEGRKISLPYDKVNLEASTEKIDEYWKKHKNNNKVVYTCIVGEYDRLINHYYISNDYDYICFTNNPALLKLKIYGVWRILPLVYDKLDDTRNNRWHKLHPHKLFSEYDESIYIDSNINILTSYIFKQVSKNKTDFLLPAHFEDNCIYDELNHIVRARKDSKENMEILRLKYEKEKMPHHLGLSENNLIYRKHHNKNIIKIMDMWWNMVKAYSKRDQASFMYVLWKNHIDIRPHLIPNLRIDGKNFKFEKHKLYQNAFSLYQIEKYKKLIDDYKIISFDIFDTLLVRPYLKPTDLFRHLEENENRSGFAEARINAEKKVRLAGKYNGDITLDMIYNQIEDEYKNMKDKEKDFEFQVCQPHPVIKKLYDYALKQGKKVIAFSDMYFSKKYMVKLLNKNSYTKFNNIFISCEEHASKRDGQLYEVVLNKLKCTPSDILHIGDNPIADGEKAVQHHISTLIIEKIGEHLLKTNHKAETLAQEYGNKFEASLYLGILALNNVSNQEYTTEQDYYENLGYEYGGIVAYQFMKFVYDNCLKNNIKDIAMVARDGYTFQKVFDILNKANLNSHYVYAPRTISNIISCRYNPDNKEQVDDFAGYYREALYHIKNTDTYSYGDSLKFIAENKDKISDFAKKKEIEYLKYLTQFKYTTSKLAVIDLATIHYTSQKLFEKIYPEKEVTGYYWRINSREIFDNNAFDRKGESIGILCPWDFMEFLFTAPEFPIKDIVDGKPVYKNTEINNEQFRMEVYPWVSNGIVKFVQDVKKIFGDQNVTIRPFMVANWINILRQNPTKEDKKFMKKLSYASDVGHNKYKQMFKSWY